jgi:hypothetical protein
MTKEVWEQQIVPEAQYYRSMMIGGDHGPPFTRDQVDDMTALLQAKNLITEIEEDQPVGCRIVIVRPRYPLPPKTQP